MVYRSRSHERCANQDLCSYDFYANGPRLHEFLQDINKQVLSKYDSITVGEMPFVRDDKEILKVVGADRGELNMIFIFEIVDIDNDESGFRLTLRDWDANEIKQIMYKWQKFMIENDGWNSLFIENHGRSCNCHPDEFSC